jgi:hypothetical protein
VTVAFVITLAPYKNILLNCRTALEKNDYFLGIGCDLLFGKIQCDRFLPVTCRENAMRFSTERFQTEFLEFVQQAWGDF